MNSPLPTKSEQKRLPFRPYPEEAVSLYRAINRYVFDNQLTRPEIILKPNLQKAWGVCNWKEDRQKSASWGRQGTWCTIELMDKWFCPQWFCNTLAHEMVHQWQYDVYRWDHMKDLGREMYWDSGGHGPSFHSWRERFAEHGLYLKQSHGMKRWLKFQDFRKC
jgi:hypothetical protein